MHPDKARLVYEKFDTAITARYGVAIEGWPPGIPFCSPGDLQTRFELDTLFASWQSGTTRFIKLSPAEVQVRLLALTAPPPPPPPPVTQAQVLPETGAGVSAPSSSTPTQTGVTVALSEPIAGPSSSPASSGVLSLNTGPVAPGSQSVFSLGDPQMTNKPQKYRADRGRKRGPNKRTLGRSQQ